MNLLRRIVKEVAVGLTVAGLYTTSVMGCSANHNFVEGDYLGKIEGQPAALRVRVNNDEPDCELYRSDGFSWMIAIEDKGCDGIDSFKVETPYDGNVDGTSLDRYQIEQSDRIEVFDQMMKKGVETLMTPENKIDSNFQQSIDYLLNNYLKP